MPGEPSPPRHALVWIRPDRRAAVRARDPAFAAEVAGWLARDRPAVARRRDPAAEGEELALAIVLPAAAGRARIALSAPADAIARVAPPTSLAEALPSVPSRWAPLLAELEGDARRSGVPLRVYGSLAWQHLTGEAYLRPGSDVDLLAPGATPDERARSLALLRRWEALASPRLDGELELGGGRAVAWRELLAPAGRVLVKAGGSVSLERLEDALGAGGPG